MRTVQWKAQLLLLLLLSLHSVSVCLAIGCTYDYDLEGVDPLTVATAAAQPTGQDWEPLRIVTSTKDFQGPSKYCKPPRGSIQLRGTESSDSTCLDLFSSLSPEERNIMTGVVERAITLHTDRLLVQRTTGPLIIPDFSSHEYCKYFNIPAEHHTNGVANADMVLYVAFTRESDGTSSPSLGLTCAKSADGRPIAGGFIVGSATIKINRHTVRLAAHHIAHALGFSYGEMNSSNMIINENVRGKPNPVAVVKSGKTKEMAQAQYGCPTANGMELDDNGGREGAQSHWGQRNAKDELMALPLRDSDTAFMGFYSNITLAAFEDLGFFKANFRMAEHMEYGYNKGCDLLTGNCMENGVSKWPDMFCDVSQSNGRAAFCSTNRLGLGGCAVQNNKGARLGGDTTPAKLNPNRIAGDLDEDCPVVEEVDIYRCGDSKVPESMPGSLVAENSMCLDGSALKVNTSTGSIDTDGVCAQISCEGGSVRVKYLGDSNTWHACPEGESLTPSSTSASFVSGTIKCPKYKEVCTIAPDGSSLFARDTPESIEPSTSTPPTASHKPIGHPNSTKSGGNPKDGSLIPFCLFPSAVFLVLSFSGYMLA